MPLNGSLNANSIYISLNSRPKKGEYHWGLILTDSQGHPTLHHATNRAGPWTHEQRQAKPEQSMSLIALVLVAKLKSHSASTNVINSHPADGNPSKRTGESFTCLVWLKDVLMLLQDRGEITLPTDIDNLERLAEEYALEYSAESEAGKGATVINNPI